MHAFIHTYARTRVECIHGMFLLVAWVLELRMAISCAEGKRPHAVGQKGLCDICCAAHIPDKFQAG